MYIPVIHYHESKLFSGIDILEKTSSASNSTNALLSPQTYHTAEKIGNVSAVVRQNMFQTIVQITESVGISEATCQRILNKDFNMHRVCQFIVPFMLNKDKKVNQMEMPGDYISAAYKDSSLLGRTFLETRNDIFNATRNPRKHRHCGNHQTLHKSRNSVKFVLKRKLC
ncbi:uncharacterized protein TNCV_437401 [Trichonephila clavipes]|nr:uncharacterized protein TNCV_437401 [Trichonephila clavipes]